MDKKCKPYRNLYIHNQQIIQKAQTNQQGIFTTTLQKIKHLLLSLHIPMEILRSQICIIFIIMDCKSDAIFI